jgi:hypothetical protein
MEVREMAEKQYTYTAKIKQPQTVAGVKLDPKGSDITEREYKILKKDAYGASLLEKGLLVIKEVPAQDADEDQAQDAADNQPEATAVSDASGGDSAGETIPDFEAGEK